MKKLSALAVIAIVSGTLIPAPTSAAPSKPTTTTITSSASPVVMNTPVTLTATVTGSGNPNGSIVFTVSGTSIGSCTTSASSCSVTYSWTARNEFPVIATYTPTTNHAGSTSAVFTQVVTRYPSSVVVASSKPNAYIGNPLDFTITASGAGPTPTGSAILYAYESNTVIGSCTLAAASCVIHLAASTVGNHRVWAGYSGDDVTYLPSNSSYIYQKNDPKLTPTITLAHSPSPTDFGSAIALTATVTGAGITPVGDILFENTEQSLGSCTLVAGTCTLSYSTLSAGPHQIVAEFGGDDTYLGAEIIVTHQVNSLTSASLIANPTRTAIGAPVILTATFPSAGSYAATIVIAEDGVAKGTCTLASSSCTYSYSPTTAANHLMTATLLGNATLETATASVYLPVVAHISTLVLTSSSNPAPRLTLVTFTAVLQSTATGLVIFEDGETQIGSCTLTSGQCSETVSFATTGTHRISAEYGGDALNSSVTTKLDQVVGITATTVALASDLVDAKYYDTINFTATVSDSSATGIIEVFDGANGIKSCTLVSGACTLFYYRLSVGSHNMTAVYGGDVTHAGSTSPVLIQVVALGATTTTMQSSENPFVQAAGLILTATVTSDGVGATGVVQFEDYTNATEVILGSCTLVGTSCFIELTTPLPTGSRKLRAEYASDGKYAGSVSAQFNQVVNQGSTHPPVETKTATTATINVIPLSVVYLDPFSVTATLSSTGGTPTGTVIIEEEKSGGSDVILGSCALSSGNCTYSNSTLSVGTHTIYFEYGGTTTFAASASARVAITVTPRPVQAVVAKPVETPAKSEVVVKPGTPLVTSINATQTTSLTFSTLDSNGRKSDISITVPAGAISGTGTLSITPEPDVKATDKGFESLIIQVLSTDASPISTLAKPIVLKVSRQATLGQPAVSQDGVTWVALQKVSGTTLDAGQMRGYFVGESKSLTIMTLQFSAFDLLKRQNTLSVKVPLAPVAVGTKLELTSRGGSGSGEVTFIGSTPSVCSVSPSGSVVALAAGQCTVAAAKGHDESHMDATSALKSFAIRP